MGNKHVVKGTALTTLVLPYLGLIALQARTKLKNSLKYVLNCCQMQTVFKNKSRLDFHFKYRIPKDLTSVVHKFLCGLCSEPYYDKFVRQLNVRKDEHIGVLPLNQETC